MATILTENFNSYTNGTLVGQGSWTQVGGVSPFVVEGSVVKEGEKAVVSSGTGAKRVEKVGTETNAGRITFYMRIGSIPTAGKEGAVWILDPGSANYVKVCFTNTGIAVMAVEIQTGYNLNQWYCIEVEWWAGNPYLLTHFRIDGGSWYELNPGWAAWAYGYPKSIQLRADDGVTDFYVDYIAEKPYVRPWPNGWSYRKAIVLDTTVAGANVGTTQSDFPVLVEIDSSETDFWANVLSNGGDVRFTSSDGTTFLKKETESFNYAGTSAFYWVKVPSVAGGSSTTIYVYYGKVGQTTDDDKNNVWDANYAAVYHLSVNHVNGYLSDSTINNNVLTGAGPDDDAGEIDRGRNFIKTNSDYMSAADSDSLLLRTGLTISMWMKEDASGGSAIPIAKYNADDALREWYMTTVYATNRIDLILYDQDNVQSKGIRTYNYTCDGNWRHVAVTWNGTSGTGGLNIYVDGVSDAAPTLFDTGYITMKNTATLFTIGRAWTPSNPYYYDGGLDEVEVSKIARSSGWVKLSFENQKTAQSLVTIGAQVGPPPLDPSALSATAMSSSEIDLSWTAGSVDEDGFKIERKTGVGGVYAQIDTVGAGITVYQDIDLDQDTNYWYRVYAFNDGGDSDYSNEDDATTDKDFPDNRLNWTNNASDIDGIKIERKIGAGIYQQIAIVSSVSDTYLDTDCFLGAYYYRVRAYKGYFNSPYSNEASDYIELLAPSNLSGTYHEENTEEGWLRWVQLTWDNHNITYDSTKIERCLVNISEHTSGEYSLVFTITAGVSTCSDSTVTVGHGYNYRAYDCYTGVSDSPYSNIFFIDLSA